PPPPAGTGPVGERAGDRLPDHGDHRPDPLQHAQRRSLPGAAHDLPDRVGEDQGAQALPEVADRDPVESQDREVEMAEPRAPGDADGGDGHPLGRSCGPKWPTPGTWSPIRMTQGASLDLSSWVRNRSW